ncbi:MAG TPA: cell division protein FtsZ, partial [Erythrobacter sp.]
ISIIGGEDMRLLEVDEAANHIRELVDEDANIIWGSAFNPDLKGKIRVSVVATGIEQSAIGQSERSQPVSLGGARAPKRPVLELSDDEGFGELPPVATPAPAAPTFDLGAAPATTPVSYDDEPLDLAEEADGDEDGDYGTAAPFELTGMQAGDDYGEEYEDDVDDIVDPLAGLRGADTGASATPGYGYAATPAAADEDEPLELDGGYAPYSEAEDEGPAQDDLLASADRLAAEDRPVEARLGGGRRRGLLGGEGGAGGGAGGGSTLFERMANLSRSTARDDEDEDDGDEGPALSIPRVLGRQNNQ